MPLRVSLAKTNQLVLFTDMVTVVPNTKYCVGKMRSFLVLKQLVHILDTVI